MSLFGANSLGNLLLRPDSAQQSARTAEALDLVARAAEDQMDPWAKSVAETGNRIQEGLVNLTFGGELQATGAPESLPVSQAASPQPSKSNRDSAPVFLDSRRGANETPTPTSEGSFEVELSPTTQGPLWPPSEVMDQNGDFILIGGLILKEVAPGRITPVANRTGVIVSKDTKPPLNDGLEDFSNPFGAPYGIIRELDLSLSGADWDVIPYTLSCGPFDGHFGGGRPRIPAIGYGQYNLNSNPRWNKSVAPVGGDSPGYRRASYPLHEVPINGLQEIPERITIGARVDSGDRSNSGVARADFRARRLPITLRDLLSGRGNVQISLFSDDRRTAANSARFDFSFQHLLPHALYALFAVHAISLSPPDTPNFILPVPIGFPSVLVTDDKGDASASFVLHNPFPDPTKDPEGNRLAGIAILYLSDFQNWGAVLTSLGTGATAHTVLSCDLRHLTSVITKD